MYEFLKHTHSIVRYLVLIGGIGAIIGLLGSHKARAKTFSTIFLASTHLQFVIGLLLYFVFGPWLDAIKQMGGGIMKDSYYRFFAVEHISMMVIAAILITIGHSKLKKAYANDKRPKATLIIYFIALALILAAIPWPFREALGKGWY